MRACSVDAYSLAAYSLGACSLAVPILEPGMFLPTPMAYLFK